MVKIAENIMLIIDCYTKLNIVTSTRLTIAIEPVLELGSIVCNLNCICSTG